LRGRRDVRVVVADDLRRLDLVWLVGVLQGLLPGRGIRRTCCLPVGFSRPAFGPGADATVAKTAPTLA
jgi:hypothetical protein